MTNKFLVFDIWSCYGHFRKPYTTTSPLTYSIPTRTAIAGIIAAIIGLDKTEYNGYFTKDKAHIAVGIKSIIKKVRISENLINTKKSIIRIKERTQINIEFLKDPCYRIYFAHKDEALYNKLKEQLTTHSSVYTISMGLSENLANYQYVGEYDADIIDNSQEAIELSTIVLTNNLQKGKVEFEVGKEYFTENIPLEMTNDRMVNEYGEVLFERTGKAIMATLDRYYNIQQLDENISII